MLRLMLEGAGTILPTFLRGVSVLIAAVNFEEKIALLSDGRQLPIAGLYASSGPVMLKATDAMLESDRVDDPEIAEVFVIQFPDGVFVAVEMGALKLEDTGKH